MHSPQPQLGSLRSVRELAARLPNQFYYPRRYLTEQAERRCDRRNSWIELAQVRANRQREAVIYEQPAVREAVVFGVPDPQ
jgi:hypothetical protein